MKEAHTAQRIAAYIIDIIIVSIITLILACGIPRSDKYKKAVEDNDTLVDKILNNENEEDYINKFYENEYVIEKETFSENLIETSITIGYFVIFAFLNKGQTVGKKLVKIRVVSKDETDASYIQLFGRSLIINDCFYAIVSLIIINLIKPNQFLYTIGILGFVHSLFLIGTILMAICRKDKRGLHDIIAKTKVVEC